MLDQLPHLSRMYTNTSVSFKDWQLGSCVCSGLVCSALVVHHLPSAVRHDTRLLYAGHITICPQPTYQSTTVTWVVDLLPYQNLTLMMIQGSRGHDSIVP